ncbi:uncharacterized protein GLRG_04961 [Colletotrichum graminicola M1.001]|uniref:Uncharacterized protein n=1 Tax=Colletotrichum graminicola (strain M1.001 / M2 / FGSC 10212) TaxID=645133 RepID=E3QFY2_COLGM|nr:uncharacterized protein GLRG_04961 [Colletotrichum graminicola M1.001]EFQ29817.1 hypothetical protein GLRG_04961 [Colletotrichum graminicola M1.001]
MCWFSIFLVFCFLSFPLPLEYFRRRVRFIIKFPPFPSLLSIWPSCLIFSNITKNPSVLVYLRFQIGLACTTLHPLLSLSRHKHTYGFLYGWMGGSVVGVGE